MDLFPAIKYVVADEDIEHIRAYITGMIALSWPNGREMMQFEANNITLEVVNAINSGSVVITDPKIASLAAAVKLFFATPVRYDNQGKQENIRRFRERLMSTLEKIVTSNLPKPDPHKGNYVNVTAIINMDDPVKSSSEYKNPGFTIMMANKDGKFIQHHFLKLDENDVDAAIAYAIAHIGANDNNKLTMFSSAHLNDSDKLHDLLENSIIDRWRKLGYSNV